MTFNLAVILSESAAAAPERAVASFAEGQLTYGELDALTDKIAATLTAKGLWPGDMVALQLPNIPQFLISYFGILKAGGVVVPLSVMLRAPQVELHLADSGARTLITMRHQMGTPGALPYEQLLATPADRYPMAQREPADTAVVVYTAGTSGKPKGAELTHSQLYMNADIPARTAGVLPGDTVLAVLPLFHVVGLSSIVNLCVRFGCAMSLVPRWDARAVLAAIERDKCTIFYGVPAMFAELLACPDLDRYDVSSLRLAVSGGASIPAPLLDAFEARFRVLILEGYGLTETAATPTQNRSAAERRVHSVGKPLSGTETQVWDENGTPLPRGRNHVGEIVTRGPHVMKGYLNDPEATAAAITDGWLHTGDLGYFDEDGFLFIVSRKKDLIIRGGYNVYPSEIENVLHAHPAIAEAAVVGVPDERLGQEVLAAVILRAGGVLEEAELIAYCRKRMADYKYPRIIDFRSELPKNTLGKVLKDELAASWARTFNPA